MLGAGVRARVENPLDARLIVLPNTRRRRLGPSPHRLAVAGVLKTLSGVGKGTEKASSNLRTHNTSRAASASARSSESELE